MKLTDVWNEKQQWLDKGYEVFSYDRCEMVRRSIAEPEWVHFGAGNLFRAFQAVYADELLDAGILTKGISAVGGRNPQIIDTFYRDLDNLHISVTLKNDGSLRKRVVGSIAESLKIDDTDRLKEIFASPSLKVATFTITEKGYKVTEEELKEQKDPEHASSYFGRIAALLHHRYRSGALPLTLSSQDNCSHNGDVLKEVIRKFAGNWKEEGFMAYVEEKLAFPISMIDKITPRPDRHIAASLKEDGVEEIDRFDPDHYMNCFVNAEECQYLVIEDHFRNGRPQWEQAGIIFTDRQTVDLCERMKVTTCLNPVHTSLAIFGCLLGYRLISEEMQDETLRKLAEHVGYDEGLPVVSDPGILDPKEFIDTVLQERLKNPYLPDTPQRIAMDTSQKLPVRFGETLKAYQAKGKNLCDLHYIPLVFSGWLRYLTGLDDEGKEMTLSSDPLLEQLQPLLQYKLGDRVEKKDILPILQNKEIFGVDLEKAGLADRITDDLNGMLKEAGAVRRTLEKHV